MESCKTLTRLGRRSQYSKAAGQTRLCRVPGCTVPADRLATTKTSFVKQPSRYPDCLGSMLFVRLQTAPDDTSMTRPSPWGYPSGTNAIRILGHSTRRPGTKQRGRTLNTLRPGNQQGGLRISAAGSGPRRSEAGRTTERGNKKSSIKGVAEPAPIPRDSSQFAGGTQVTGGNSGCGG